MNWEEIGQKIADALGGHETKRGWSVLCPNHDDHEPSLDVDIKEDTLLFKCRVGCDQEAVLSSLVSMGLWPSRPRAIGKIKSDENRVATYPYTDLDGVVMAYKDRYESFQQGKRRKTFGWRSPDGEDGLPDGTDHLYAYNAAMVPKQESATVLVVEGEKVVHRLRLALDEQEFVAISMPGGSDSAWTEHNVELLRGRKVVVLPDEDDAGYKFLGRTLGALAGVASASWLKLPGLLAKEDAVDWFDKGHTADEFLAALTDAKSDLEESELPAPEGTLPHDAAAERALLGAVLLRQGDAFEAIRLEPEDFYIRAHQIIWKAFTALYEGEKALGANTVRDHLLGIKQLGEAGGVAYLRTLEKAGKTHYADFLDEQTELVRKASVRRKLIVAGERVVSIGWEGKLDPEDAVQGAWDEVSAVASEQAGDFSDMPGLITAASARLEALAASKSEYTGLTTGFRDLDRKTSGLQNDDLIIVAARPSMGKTALGLQILLHTAKSGKVVALFSVEMGKDQITQRLLVLQSGLDGDDIRTGKIGREDAGKVREALDRLKRINLFVDDRSATVLEMQAKAKRLKRERGLDLVMVDYLQLMSGSNLSKKFGSVYETTEISKGLKRLARTLHVPVVALSQLSRSPEQRADKRPVLSDLRDTGAIEQDADLVLFLYRDEYYNPIDSDHPSDAPGTAELEIGKHRNGPTGRLYLDFCQERMEFSSWTRMNPDFAEEAAS